MQISKQAQADFHSHVLDVFPQEACGLIVSGKYVRCTNTAENPLTDFRIPAHERIWATKDGGVIEAVMHSHPYDMAVTQIHPPAWPSTKDMTSWLANPSIPWGIVATEGENVSALVWLEDEQTTPVVGRQFVHGVFDCYSIVRDYYWQVYGIKLKNYARGWGWWETDANLYERNFKEAGWHEVSLEDIQVGDALLMQYGARWINHAALVTGNNEITHHLFHRLSGKDQLNKWQRSIKKAVRYTAGINNKNENNPSS